MTTTTFTDKVTRVEADWANDVDAVTYQALGDGADNPPTTPAQVRTNIDVNSATDLASTANAKGASLIGIEDTAGNFTATDVEAALAEQVSNMASTANGKGASLIGIEDTAGNLAATDVEAALAEIYTDFTLSTDLASTSNAKGASLIGVEDASGYFIGTDVEAVLDELHEGNTITLGTPTTTTSGTSHDYTSIPSWVKKITIPIAGISTSGTSPIIIQIGDSGGIEATSYVGSGQFNNSGGGDEDAYTTGFPIGSNPTAATAAMTGTATLVLVNSSTNLWLCTFTGTNTTTNTLFTGSGYKALSATLDRVRLTTVGGTDTFDAGSFNILYE